MKFTRKVMELLEFLKQKNRNYEWNKHGIKPDVYVFGSKPQNIAFNGVSKCIAEVLTSTEEDRGPVVIQRSVSFPNGPTLMLILSLFVNLG